MLQPKKQTLNVELLESKILAWFGMIQGVSSCEHVTCDRWQVTGDMLQQKYQKLFLIPAAKHFF